MTEKDVLNIPGFEWAIFRLGTMSKIVSIDVDTSHFKGNAPEHVTIEGTPKRGDFTTDFSENEWIVIIDKMKLQPHKAHSFKKEIKNAGPFNCVRITMAPDGGISRVRIHGQVFIEKNETPEVPKTTDVPEVMGSNEEHSNSNSDEKSINNSDEQPDVPRSASDDKQGNSTSDFETQN